LTASFAFFSAFETVVMAAFVLATYFLTALSILLLVKTAGVITVGVTISSSSSLSLSESINFFVAVLATTCLTILALALVSASTLAALAAVLAAAFAEGEILSSSESWPVTLVV